MIFAEIDVWSFLAGMSGREILLITFALSLVFIFCFARAIVSWGVARGIVKTKEDRERLEKEKLALEAQRDAIVAELASKRDEREAYAVATKFLELQPHLAAEHEKLEKAIADKELTLSKINEELKEATKKVEDLKKISWEIADLERDKMVIDKECDDARQARDDMRKQNENEEKKNQSLRDEYKNLIGKNQDLEKQIGKAERKKEDLDRNVSELTKKKAEAEEWLDKNKDKIRDRDSLDEQIADKQRRVDNLDKQIEKGQQAVSDTMDRIDKGLDRLNKMNLSGVQTLRQNAFVSLTESVFDASSKTTEAAFGPNDEATAISAVAAHFERSGFVVPRRLLKAFHTSLKTSDMSSLTVMAGVSGTGKSAIPKLYAEAMGIAFQPLAVEPRWDSPKDLLGFFNYVTNRYEPTLLARALFQFQGLHSESFKPVVDMSNYMLMPMLDEMNLARIEYYFSEFLSKLEMRRLVAPLTRQNIGHVALEIFQGWKGKMEDGQWVEEAPIHLFANQNTLFVGTMNEDETTQSLSDKVIDRANVLYFGRPNRLQGRAGGGGDAVSRAPLLKTTWQSWHKEPDEGELKFASDILSSLNKTLADFNRPFAHRTYQAMLSYIANYPIDDGEDRSEAIRRALADQIGMRIMPKLYGVDLQLHQGTFGQVRKNLTDVGDRMLLTAFDAASDRQQNKSGFFHWTGFDWNA